MKMFALMLKPTRSLWTTGEAVIIDRNLCVLKGILGMKKNGGVMEVN